jgi:hypothetical protein
VGHSDRLSFEAEPLNEDSAAADGLELLERVFQKGRNGDVVANHRRVAYPSLLEHLYLVGKSDIGEAVAACITVAAH